MPGLESLRRQLASVEELGSIVHTMKSLAAVHVRQYERAARALARFDEAVELGFQVLLRAAPLGEPLAPRGETRVAAVVLGTAQGMCGPFVERVVSCARGHMDALEPGARRGPVLAVGARTVDHLLDTELAPEDSLDAPSSLATVTALVEELIVRIEAWRAAGRLDRLLVFHNRRVPGASSAPRALQLLPLPGDWLRELARRPWTGPSLPTFTLEPEALLAALVRQQLFGALYRAVVESLESENLSRLAAMQAAETNIAELREELGDAFRRERQSAIMAELLDIVSGYAVTQEARGADRSTPARGAPGAGRPPRGPRAARGRG